MAVRKLPIIEEGDFREVIDIALKEKRHTEYLKKVLVDFEEYKQVFSQVFTTEGSLKTVYIFRFHYINKQPLWRDIAILGRQTLSNLAETVIEWMNWDNDHMHGFSLKKLYEKPLSRYSEFSLYAPGWEDDPYPTFKTNKIKVADINWQKYPKWNFVFDFGASHEFDVELRKIETKLTNEDFEESLPMCIDQRGVAPCQYPEYDGPKEWEFEGNCPHCQALKENGNKLSWFPDEDKKLIRIKSLEI